MKKITLILISLSAAVSIQAQREVTSRLDKVTVYPSHALVEKSVRVNLVKGDNKFIITDNATTFSKDNLHFMQQEDFFITSVNLKDVNKSFNQAAKEKFSANVYSQITALNDKAEKIRLQIKDNNRLIAAYNQQLNALNNLKAVKNTQAIDTVSILKEQFEFQRQEGVKLNSLIAKAQKENEELGFNLIRTEDELENMIKQNNGNCLLTTKSKNIIVNIYSNRNMTADLQYDYLVSSVASNYSYDVNLNENLHTAVFNLKTAVQQFTNENWKDCSIVFSTNEGGWAGEDAELYTWYLNNTPQYQATKMKKAEKAVLTSNMAAARYDTQAADADIVMSSYSKEASEMPVIEAVASAENLTLGREYTLNTEQSVASNDKPQVIPLTFDTVKAEFKHFATPKNTEKVYYTALLPDWEDAGLQNTGCDIFLNGKYIAKSYINTSSAKDTMKFSAGEDKSVKITRKVRKSTPDKGFLSSNVEETVSVVIVVKNTKNQAVDLEIKDQIPVSQNADIKVTVADSGGGNLNNATGIIKWNITMQPKQTKEIKFSYTVKYPKDFNLILN